MDKKEITNACVDQRFERSQRDTLEDAGPQKTVVVIPASSGPRSTDYHQDISNDE